jgi:hypothetical protein
LQKLQVSGRKLSAVKEDRAAESKRGGAKTSDDLRLAVKNEDSPGAELGDPNPIAAWRLRGETPACRGVSV